MVNSHILNKKMTFGSFELNVRNARMFDLDAPFHDYMIPIYGIQGHGLKPGQTNARKAPKEESQSNIQVLFMFTDWLQSFR